MMDKHPIVGGGGGNSRNTPSYATETGISADLMGHLAHMQI